MDLGRMHGQWWSRWQTAEGALSAPDGASFDGRFVRLFPRPKADRDKPDPDEADPDEAALAELAAAMTSPLETPPTPETERDDEENIGTADAPGIPAAYTYFGQFVDHDLTLDPTSNLRGAPMSDRQLIELLNFRTPRFDLDCLYGRGPADQPYLYQPDSLRLLLGTRMSGNPHDTGAVDVPRGPNGRALIGDPRNDENRIVSQLQATMLRFHNSMVHLAVQDVGSKDGVRLADVQRQVQWHYQWVVVHDFLPTIIQPSVLDAILGTDRSGAPLTFLIPSLRDRCAALDRMPVEFSVAAYRFGHSMIRPIYRINETIERRQIFSSTTDPAGDLGGMRPIPDDWAVDWQYFLDIEHRDPQAIPGDDQVVRKPQFSYKIDTALVNPLATLPAVIAANPAVLAERNLLRGRAFRLPTGQEVAEALHMQPLKPDEIWIGKATGNLDDKRPISEIADGVFADRTPLWTYVLAEAWQTSLAEAGTASASTAPIRLGPVGGHLVAETILALLYDDPNSYLNAPGGFEPDPRLRYEGRFGLAELINTAIRGPGADASRTGSTKEE